MFSDSSAPTYIHLIIIIVFLHPVLACASVDESVFMSIMADFKLACE